MAEIPMIYSAISACMAEVGAISKDKTNIQQNFKYRGIDDVMNALQPVLIKNKVFVVPEVLDERREERVTKSGGSLIYTVLKIKYTFYAADGSSVSAVVIGEGMDSGDKSANKAQAVAMKYACFQVLCIPTEEMRDPDSETPEPSTPKTEWKTEQKAKTEQKSTKVNFINPEQRRELADILRIKYGDDQAPKKLKEITGYESTKIIPVTEFSKVKQMITMGLISNADADTEDDCPLPWETEEL